MKKKLFLVCIYLFVFQNLFVFAQQESNGKWINFSGTWASNYLENTSTDFATFIHIEEVYTNSYLIISYSNESNYFSYVGGGFVTDDGILQVTTDKGFVHLFFEGNVRGEDEALALSDPEYIEIFGPYIRIEDKFSSWPFPIGK